MKRILFWGDSITDARRSREEEDWLGSGYVALLAAQIGLEHPGEYEFLNRGISGDRVVDLYARIKSDCINLRPDYLSILIGVNDVLYEAAYSNGVSAEKFEKVLRIMLEEIQEELPTTKIILMEPFVFLGSSTAQNWGFISKEVPKRAEAVRRIAQDIKIPCIRLQEIFEQNFENAPQAYYVRDGVHPTIVGHGLVAREWKRIFNCIPDEQPKAQNSSFPCSTNMK